MEISPGCTIAGRSDCLHPRPDSFQRLFTDPVRHHLTFVFPNDHAVSPCHRIDDVGCDAVSGRQTCRVDGKLENRKTVVELTDRRLAGIRRKPDLISRITAQQFFCLTTGTISLSFARQINTGDRSETQLFSPVVDVIDTVPYPRLKNRDAGVAVPASMTSRHGRRGALQTVHSQSPHHS